MKGVDYINTFIAVAEDCPAASGQEPQPRGTAPTVPVLQFQMIAPEPYKHTSADVLFTVHAVRHGYAKKDWPKERAKFFSKGQPCLRCSALGKTYGWGIHCNAEGKVALYSAGSKEYKAFVKDKTLLQTRAMRSKKP